MNWEMIYESIKAPLRQALLFVYAWLLNWLFGFITKSVGFEFTDEQKLQLLGFGTPIVWSILSFIDRFMHELGKEKEEKGTVRKPVTSLLTKGISRF